jgi:hypothetical protein
MFQKSHTPVESQQINHTMLFVVNFLMLRQKSNRDFHEMEKTNFIDLWYRILLRKNTFPPTTWSEILQNNFRIEIMIVNRYDTFY